MTTGAAGPLSGLKVLEFAALGPAPFAAMMLADMGAEVLAIERAASPDARPLFDPDKDILRRSKKILNLDLKRAEDRAMALRLAAKADILIEGFRPGVMERLGLGPTECLAVNPRLVYGRMTGWGQDGPLAQAAGHDINYLALSGALAAIGEAGGKPVPPLNLVADGGGALLLALGVMSAQFSAAQSGRGQVVDAAMTDGSALLMTMMHTLKAMGHWTLQRGENLLDGGAHFYGSYACRDGKHLAIGPIEPAFYRRFLALAGITDPEFEQQWHKADWPALKEKLAQHFLTRTRDEWCAILEGTEACVAPVLDMEEAPLHPHNLARGTFVELAGVTQAAPAPRFSHTPNATPKRPEMADGATLAAWGLTQTLSG